MYASEAGIIDLGSEQKIMSVTLKPRFGYLEYSPARTGRQSFYKQ